MNHISVSICLILIVPVIPVADACDTWVAMGDMTYNGRVLFGKNSDRPPFDCQPLVYNPRQNWAPGTTLKLEYIEVPQANVTYSTIGCSPYWCYGYEMGVNEWGVVAGNEALWTTTLAITKLMPPERGFVGMDLLRIGLERSRTAYECVMVITSLLEQYGQWGSAQPCMNDSDGSYDNGFIIADPNEAWILETAGKDWVAKRITTGTESISNAPSIGSDWDEGTLPPGTNFMLLYSDHTQPPTLSGRSRELRSQMLLDEYSSDKITLREMMAIARDHNLSVPGICMHEIEGISESRTAGSMIVILPETTHGLIEIWWTPALPCRGIYVPIFFENGVCVFPDIMNKTGMHGKTVTAPNQVAPDSFNISSYWWLFKNASNLEMNETTRKEFDTVEVAFESAAGNLRNATALQLYNFTERCADVALFSILTKRLVGIDNEKPMITVSARKNNDGTTIINGTFMDNIKVEKASIRIFIEGKDVTDSSLLSVNEFRYITRRTDPFSIRIQLRDVSGNEATFETEIKAQKPSVIPGFEIFVLLPGLASILCKSKKKQG